MLVSSALVPALQRCQLRVQSRLVRASACHFCSPFRPARPRASIPGVPAKQNNAGERRSFTVLSTVQDKAAPQLAYNGAQAFSSSTSVEDVGGDPRTQPLQTLVLDVGGMKCGGCSAAVKRILTGSPHVAAASVNLVTGSAAVSLPAASDKIASRLAEDLAQLLTSKGFPSHLRKADDLLQDEEERAKERSLELRKSLVDLGVAWALALLCCTHHLGHFLHSVGWHTWAHSALMSAMADPRVSAALGAFSLLGPGRPLIVDGARSLARGTPNMNSLVGVGAVTSFSVGALAPLVPQMGFDPSFMEEPVMLLAFVLLGRALETRARLTAAADLRVLASLIPARTRLVVGGATGGPGDSPVEEAVVPTGAVRPGDLVRVLPGERFPLDGIIDSGTCSSDESLVTGESRLVPKHTGDQVTAGTVSYEGAVTVRATATGQGSTLAGIGRMVAEAQSREAPVQRLADAVSGSFCYAIMATSGATFAFWSLFGAQLFPDALDVVGGVGTAGAGVLLAVRLAVDVLVVACPCALGLATPTAVLVATSLGARRGLLLRGGDVLERIAQVNTVVLDKTGTLTEGRLRLIGAVPSAVPTAVSGDHAEASTAHADGPAGRDTAALLRVACAVESGTRHPLADAVLAAARDAGIDPAECTASDVRTVPGEGACGVVDGRLAAIGRPEWVLRQIGEPGAAPAEGGGTNSLRGETEVAVGWQGRGIMGRLKFLDTLRPDSAASVHRLQDMGVEVVVLSGDSQEATQHIAAQLGLPRDAARGARRPADKARAVEALRAQGRVVAMVGDGVNDAPALAAADVGVAMGGGLDAAGQAAGVILLGDSLAQVVEAVTLGRDTLSKIRQNLAWAMLYNVVGVPVAAGVLVPAYGIALSPSIAGGMMAFSSVAVVSNSLLLSWQWRARSRSLEGYRDRSPHGYQGAPTPKQGSDGGPSSATVAGQPV